MSQQIQMPPAQTVAVEKDGTLSRAWYIFLRSVFGKLGESGGMPAAAVTPTGSPFSYTVTTNGSVSVSGGTVSAIQIKRGATTVNTGQTTGIFPLRTNDVLIVTYSVAPTIVSLSD